MEYHCVLFTVLLQLIAQPGRAPVIIYWSFHGLTLLRGKNPESFSLRCRDLTVTALAVAMHL